MTTPTEEEARAALDKLHRFSFGATDEIERTDIASLVEIIGDALASRVSTPPSEQGSCWDEGPTLPVPPGKCAPMPPLCELPAGHLGAHRGPRNMHGLATEWMTRAPATPPTDEDEAEVLARAQWDDPENLITWDELTARAEADKADYREIRNYALAAARRGVAAGFRHQAVTTPEPEWEYTGEDATTRRFTDKPEVVAEWLRRGFQVRRRTKTVPAGPWEPVPIEGEA